MAKLYALGQLKDGQIGLQTVFGRIYQKYRLSGPFLTKFVKVFTKYRKTTKFGMQFGPVFRLVALLYLNFGSYDNIKKFTNFFSYDTIEKTHRSIPGKNSKKSHLTLTNSIQLSINYLAKQ